MVSPSGQRVPRGPVTITRVEPLVSGSCRAQRTTSSRFVLPSHTIEGVRECAVSALETGGFEGAILCCAYSSAPGVSLDPLGLRRELQQVLPPYMLPARWKQLARLPRNGNGKIDRRALRDEFQRDAAALAESRAERAGVAVPR